MGGPNVQGEILAGLVAGVDVVYFGDCARRGSANYVEACQIRETGPVVEGATRKVCFFSVP